MSVLLAFNEADSWTVAKLAEATQIKMDILIQVCKPVAILYLVERTLCNAGIKTSKSIMTLSGSANPAQIKVVGGTQP